MSTKGSITGVDQPGASLHIYTECFDEPPSPVYVEIWQQGDLGNHTSTLCIPHADALSLADDMARWAAAERENAARLAAEAARKDGA